MNVEDTINVASNFRDMFRMGKKHMIIFGAAAAGLGVGAYLATKAVDAWITQKRFEKMFDPDGNAIYNSTSWLGDEDVCDVSEDISENPDKAFMVIPDELKMYQVNPDTISMDTDGDYPAGAVNTNVNPMVETAYNISDFDGRTDGYEQKIASYFAQDDMLGELDPETEELVECDSDELMMGVEQLLDDPSKGAIFVALHSEEKVYEIIYNKDITFEEAAEDARIG